MHPVLFVNPRAGGGTAARLWLADHARARGIEVLVLQDGQDLAAVVERAVARGADVLGMAGGDGSLSVVAAAAVAHDLPFVCVPTGTRNHFALDLGVDPHDPIRALDAFGDGVERRIDVGEVDGRLFLNNVSIGVYGDAVQQSTYRDAKLRTLLATAIEDFAPTAGTSELELVDDVGRTHRNPALVLVSNNPYVVGRPVAAGARSALDGGRLGIVVVHKTEPGVTPWRRWTATSLETSAPAPVPAGIDGEAVELSPPLRFAIRAAALRVRTPPGQAAVSAS